MDDRTIFCGDCKELLRQIPDNTIRLSITSPPYNIGKEYETRKALDQYLKETEAVIVELHRVCADNGSICWQVGNYVNDKEVFPLDIYFYPIFKNLGMKLRNRIIWRFNHGLHASTRLSGRYETILWFTKSDDYIFNLDEIRIPAKYPGKKHFKGENKGKLSGNPLGKNPSDVWDIILQDWEEQVWDIPNVKSNHPEKTSHPCQFPIELVERCILALTNEGDYVFDPYAGAGSTVIASVKHSRKAIASELNENYVSICRERLSAFDKGELKIRPLGKPIHVPSGKIAKIPDEWSC